MEKNWTVKNMPSLADIERLALSLNISATPATLLLQRGITNFEEAKAFFRPELSQLHDPFLMKNMDKAVARLIQALENYEKIIIYGDYDVDGTTSVALVYSFLKKFHHNIAFYIPDRNKEGYGVSWQGIEWAKEKGASLIISLDCGIKSEKMVQRANEYGIDFIICDHHLPDEVLPPAIAVLDAKQADCEYPYKYLSGCGVGFKLMQAFCIRQGIALEKLYEYLDLVALSIASDIVPISGENRILAYFGLKKLNQNPCVGLKALREIAGIKPEKELNINNVVFMLGPRINAAGRVEHADTAVHLMLAEEETEAENFAQQLNKQNTSRREFDATMMDEAMEIMRTNLSFQHMKTTVLFGENWNKGVIGIVASRLIEHYHRPTIVLTKNHGKLTGSARSVQGFDVHAAISQCADLLDQFGGHNFAAGLSMPEENLEAFRERFEQVVTNMISKEMLVPSLNVDMPLHLGQINNRMLQIIKQMAPFGPDNVEPTFVSEKVWLSQPTYTMKDKHLKLRIHQPGSDDFDAVAFGMSDFKNKLSLQKPFDICYHINENHYNDHVSLQLMIKDIKV